MRRAVPLLFSLAATAAAADPLPATEGPVPAATQAAPDAAEHKEPSFDVLEFDVVGNTVLQPIEIERAVYRHLGPGRSLRDVEGARDDLQALYQAQGYLTVSVDIPEQKVDQGVVRLRVTEGKVERVRVTGSRYYSLGWIREKVAELAPGTVPYFPEVQRELAEVNRTPDRKVAPQLRPGSTPGTVAVELAVQDQAPVHGELELNSRRGPNTSETRLSGSLRYDNLWQSDHSLSVQYQLAPQHPADAQVWSGTYVAPLGGDRTLALFAVHSSSNTAAIGTLDVIGNGDIGGVRYILGLPGDAEYYQSLTLGADHKRFGETVTLVGGDNLRTPISYTPFLVQYGGTEIDPHGNTQFTLAANFDVRRVLGNTDTAFANKRFNARASYFYLRGDVARQQQLLAGWSLHAHASGQSSSSPLISNEGFTLGGMDSVRGYLESEQVGDNGLQGALELRTPMLAPGWSGRLDEFYALAFADGGVVRLKDALPGQRSVYALHSRGVGLRMTGRPGLKLGIDVARAFHETQYTRDGQVRVQFQLILGF